MKAHAYPQRNEYSFYLFRPIPRAIAQGAMPGPAILDRLHNSWAVNRTFDKSTIDLRVALGKRKEPVAGTIWGRWLALEVGATTLTVNLLLSKCQTLRAPAPQLEPRHGNAPHTAGREVGRWVSHPQVL